ncbi:hypothetical protein FDI21_gp029 [Pseudomonas phage Noxifer]|uniref:Uncharacterized protein n=1 Tax=Pseudomonas phage Noxifer TaxID=2006684 RepID=A0A1Y0SUY1_9CAUD|nr:hypothetical protein FDI21_gp029 [Pseudomonas phage Noxifer]ARV77200.1 hypothetical protein NOXIFER_29 [Pseudomonas phage Noxifer]
MRTIVVALLNKPANYDFPDLPVTFNHPTVPGVRFMLHADPQTETHCANQVHNYDLIMDLKELNSSIPLVKQIVESADRLLN